MNARIRTASSLLLSLALSLPATASAVVGDAAAPGAPRSGKAGRGGRADPGAARYEPTQVIVRYRAGVKEDRRAAIRAHAGVRRIRALRLGGSELAAIVSGAGVEQTVARLLKEPGVVAAQPNYLYRATDLPDDEHFGLLWGLDNVGQYIGGTRTNGVGTVDVDIDAPEAWAITKGDPSVVVGIIDTAIDVDHPDLAANVWTNPGEIPGDGIDNDHNGYVDDVHGWNFFDDTPSTWTPGEHYHATHVAGTIAAVSGNGAGVAGVAPNVRFMQLQFLGPDGSGYTSDAVDALAYARSMGVRLTSNSWGGGGFDPELHDAICGTDGIFVAAAGNAAGDSDSSPLYPAAFDCPNIVSVAALTNTGALASFSNFGATTVDVGAPGQDVLSTLPGGQYGFLSGTSMATPHVSGVVALMLSLQPGLSGAEVRQRLVETAKPLAALRGRTVSGGIVSAVNAVHALELVTDPKDGDIEVPGDEIITVTYIADVQVGPAFDAISLARGGEPVAVTRTLAGSVLRIAPAAPLPIDGVYTVTIPAGAVLDLGGRALRAHAFSFKTHDTIAPTVTRTDPADGATNAPGSQTITVTFDEDVKGGPAFANVTLTTGGTVVPVSTSTERNVLTIDPIYSLARSSTYVVNVPAGAVTDLSGNPAAALGFAFATAVDVTPPRVVSCKPPPYMQEVPTTDDLVFDYTKAVTLAAGGVGISVDCNGIAAQLAVSTSANVLTLHPLRPLESSALCLAWVAPGSLQDEYGNVNEEPNGIYFWTRDDRSPLLTATSPADGATGVVRATSILAVFDEDVVPGPSFASITLRDDAGTDVPFSWSYPDDGYGFTWAYKLAFTPADVLGSLRTYTLTVPAGAVADTSPQHNSVAAFRVTFTTERDVVKPQVIRTDPTPYATGVPTGKAITVFFSENVVPGGAWGSIALTSGTAVVPASVALSGSRLVVSPAAPLPTDARYTLTVPAGAVADLVGNPLGAAFSLVFSTPDTLPPRVVASAPAAGATNVGVSGPITVTFDEDALPGPAFGGIALRDQAGNAIAVSSAFYEDEEGPLNTYLIVTPAAPMSPSSVYTLTLPAGAVTDAVGNASVPYAFSFSTPYAVVASDPAAGALGVPTGQAITLSLFAPGTRGASFGGIALKKGTTAVPATVTLSGAVLTVQPSTALATDTSYTLTVPAGAVVSGAGIPLAPFTLGFRTFDPNVPRVTATDPANGATGVPVGAAIAVGLSESTSFGPAFKAIALRDDGGAPVPFSADYWCDDEGCIYTWLVLTPAAPLAAARTYSVSLPAGALVDASGNGSLAYTFRFTTQ